LDFKKKRIIILKKLADLKVDMATLPNGIIVATAYKPINTVNVTVAVNVGARFETERENGLSHFLEHMAFKGTETRGTKDIAVEIETLGADINAFTSRSMTAYHVTGLNSHIIPALDILSDVLKNSTLEPEEIAREKEVVIQEIHESQDDIMDIAYNAFSRTAYPNQSVGRPILGDADNVRSFDQALIREYMQKYYHAGSMMVIGVGDIDHTEFVSLVAERFGDLPNLGNNTFDSAEYVGGTTLVADSRYDQAHIILGFPAPSPYSDDFPRFKLLADVLGSGMSSPLFQEVREKRGMAYSIGSGMMRQSDHSLLIVQSATTAIHIESCLEITCQELMKIANGEIQDSDWDRARNQVFMGLAHRSDKVSGIAPLIATEMFTLNKVVSINDLYEQYTSVTKEDVIRAAKEVIRTMPSITIAGNTGGDSLRDPSEIVKEILTA